MGVISRTIGRVLKAHGLKQQLTRTFKISNTPPFAEKMENVAGFYFYEPEHSLVFYCDAKSQVQALDRTQPGENPIDPGMAAPPRGESLF